jgi:hypothetical protein
MPRYSTPMPQLPLTLWPGLTQQNVSTVGYRGRRTETQRFARTEESPRWRRRTYKCRSTRDGTPHTWAPRPCKHMLPHWRRCCLYHGHCPTQHNIGTAEDNPRRTPLHNPTQSHTTPHNPAQPRTTPHAPAVCPCTSPHNAAQPRTPHHTRAGNTGRHSPQLACIFSFFVKFHCWLLGSWL